MRERERDITAKINKTSLILVTAAPPHQYPLARKFFCSPICLIVQATDRGRGAAHLLWCNWGDGTLGVLLIGRLVAGWEEDYRRLSEVVAAAALGLKVDAAVF